MCISTIYIRKHQQEVPCGKCYQCVKRRRNDWFVRCKIERMENKVVLFGLLTYAEVGMKLEKRDVQLFLKRLRIKGYKFKYLIVGEHGEKNDRPHWHALLFSNQPISYQDISHAWKGGYKNDHNKNKAGWINFSQVKTDKALRYVIKYIYKYDGADPRFSLMVSKNPAIGISYLKNQIWHLQNKRVDFRINGRPTAMPRYYKRKIFGDYDDIKQEVNEKLAAKVAEINHAAMQQLAKDNPHLSYAELQQLQTKYHKIKHDHYAKR